MQFSAHLVKHQWLVLQFCMSEIGPKSPYCHQGLRTTHMVSHAYTETTPRGCLFGHEFHTSTQIQLLHPIISYHFISELLNIDWNNKSQLNTHIHTDTRVCTHIHACTHINTQTHTNAHRYTHALTHKDPHRHTCTHINIHTQKHTSEMCITETMLAGSVPCRPKHRPILPIAHGRHLCLYLRKLKPELWRNTVTCQDYSC